MKRVRIVNDGSGKPFDTKVTDAETGEELSDVFRAEIVFDAGEAPKAILHVWMPVVDVTVDASIVHHCPLCNRGVDEDEEIIDTTDPEFVKSFKGFKCGTLATGGTIAPGLAIVGEYRPSDEFLI